ncbi:uncharacterized protein BYT42DRAFT_611185 [Radiomyces spectabilis]|uniref:uncharacterized protein n=1 Tax=Radiomyces spectabilis TaxID=64574 RepID=UPI0022206079|nr:uncharacterized protein BYT42DRAFT_611185 [Radiomyces spectabilis]KAI8388115.1 hypothetical protein BYT42DRAFT_611185 [Radiomyces spectabilis]
MASVFYKTYRSTGLTIDGLIYAVRPTRKNCIETTYSPVDKDRFLHTSRRRVSSESPGYQSQGIGSPQVTTKTGWKRAFEDGFQLLEEDRVAKKARLDELENQFKVCR